MLAGMKFKYQQDFSFERRKEEAENIRRKYPDRVPVIVERLHGSNMPDLDKNKFLVPNEVTVGQFMWLIRRRMKISCDKAFFVYVSNTIPSSSTMISEVYDECKELDGFLYMTYRGENTYGFQKQKLQTSLY